MADEREMAAVRDTARYLMDQGNPPRVVSTSLVGLLMCLGKTDLIPGIRGLVETVFSQWENESEQKMRTMAERGQFVRLSRQTQVHNRVTNPNG
jgi:hypothetical protein